MNSQSELDQMVRKDWLAGSSSTKGFSQRPVRKKIELSASDPAPISKSIEDIWIANRASLRQLVARRLHLEGVVVPECTGERPKHTMCGLCGHRFKSNRAKCPQCNWFYPTITYKSADLMVEEILSIVSEALHKALRSGVVIENERAWLRKVASNKVADLWRKRDRSELSDTMDDFDATSKTVLYCSRGQRPKHVQGEKKTRLRSDIYADHLPPISHKTGRSGSRHKVRYYGDPTLQEVCRRLKRAKVEAAIYSLDDENYQVIKGVIVDGKTQRAISRETGKSAGQTARQLKRAKVELSNKLHRLAA